jgi:hypothetical protein
MDSDDLNLGMVNWEHGMLLSPEHFLRQERYLEARFDWLLRYGSTAYGLIGGGPRLPENERFARTNDPALAIEDNGDTLSLSVSHCRGVTPNGTFVEVQDPGISCDVSKEAFGRLKQARIFVVCERSQKEVADAPADELNPEGERQRRHSYRLALEVAAREAPYALAVGCIERPHDSLEYSRDAGFIPACTFMGAHSELMAGARDIIDGVIRLASRYTELHRAMRQFIALFKERDIDTAADVEIMGFVGRMVVALQNCVYEIVDTTQAPQSFFGHLRRTFHSAAVYLDLSPPVREYFDLLKDSGESEFLVLLEQQKKALGASPKWKIHEDLSFEVQAARDSLEALRRLENALEGKYIDFRVNPILEAMNYVYDRDNRGLYKLHRPSSRMQGYEDRVAFTFTDLGLEGRKNYRLVLVGEDGAEFTVNDTIKVEIHVNPNTAYGREPKRVGCKVRDTDQHNFEFDFEAADVAAVADLQVTLDAGYAFKVALLFIHQRFFAAKQQEAPKPLARDAGGRREPDEPERGRAGRDRLEPPPAPAPRERERDREPFGGRFEPPPPAPPRRPSPGDVLPPRRPSDRDVPRDLREPDPRDRDHDWATRRDAPERTQRLDRSPSGPDDPSNPPKRRRLG